MTTESQKAFEEFCKFVESEKEKYSTLKYSDLACGVVSNGFGKAIWDCAWQARGEFDAKICEKKVSCPFLDKDSNCDLNYIEGIKECIEAIRKVE